MRLPIPKGIQHRLRPYQERGERFVREWEWTWTKAWIAGVIIAFIAMTTLVIIPSWMLFSADDIIERGQRWQITVRDLVVLGWLNVWAVVFVVAAYQLQVLRRRFRGERQAERYSGGYR